MNKNLFFGLLDLVEVVLHGILVYMVQKYLVDNNHHHLMTDDYVYNKVYCVYLGFVHHFYSVGKMNNFHFGLVNCVGSHENLLKLLLLVVENFVFVKINDFEYLGDKI